MIHKGNFRVVLDACVLYPAPVRDILLWLAHEYLYRPKWSKQINDEWKRNLLEKRDDLEEDRIDATLDKMNKVFPDAKVKGYEKLICSVEDIPDPDDRHVVAAAIRCNADLIVTENIKDFPEEELLDEYDIGVQKADDFILSLIELDLEVCCKALKKQREELSDPPKTREEMRDTLKKCSLKKSAEYLYSNCDTN